MEIDQFFAENEFSENTEDRYKRALRLAEAEIGSLIDLDSVQFKTWLGSHDWGSSSQWIAFCAIRNYLKWAFGDQHPALKTKIRRLESKPQRALDAKQAIKLLASFDRRTIKGIRDLAICSLVLDAGFRKSEICRLDITNMDMENCKCEVVIKGGSWGKGVFSELTKLYLEEWLSVRVDIAKCGAAFVNTRTGKRLTNDGLSTIVKTWGRRIGITLTPHDLRRTFAVLSTLAGAPGRALQVAGRWKNITMVEHYTATITAEAFRPWFPVAFVMAG